MNQQAKIPQNTNCNTVTANSAAVPALTVTVERYATLYDTKNSDTPNTAPIRTNRKPFSRTPLK